MNYTREHHYGFLEEELKAQTEAFRQKLETSAQFLLLEKEELFVAQFLKFHEGEMILKFSNNRGLPRQGEYLYCIAVPKELRNYKNWEGKTYGDLIKAKTNYSEIVCIWQAPAKEKDFWLAGFRGVDFEFSSFIEDAPGVILILGPNKPPFEYILNLQKIVASKHHESVNRVLDQDFLFKDSVPYPLDVNKSIVEFVINQLKLEDTLIIQGPPGTGKTHLIAELCNVLCLQKKTVLVTALTNRALIEVADKPALKELLKKKQIFKTKLSVDEARGLKGLQQAKELSPQPGKLFLSTFYFSSGHAANNINDSQFDYVIVDEASQALLGMLAASKNLAKKVLWIGDIQQLPPVVLISEDKITKKGYGIYVEGLNAISSSIIVPNFQLTKTYRLTSRAGSYTTLFYKNNLISNININSKFTYSGLSNEYLKLFNPKGGPTLLKTTLPSGELKPRNALNLVLDLVIQLISLDEKIHISVLTYFVKTARALQKTIYPVVGYNKNLLVETVSRVQGLTTDVTIFVIPNTMYHRSLDPKLFNVATSRSKRHTLIISDSTILDQTINSNVELFLNQLNDEDSFEKRTFF